MKETLKATSQVAEALPTAGEQLVNTSRAGTVEFDATVNGKNMYAYYVPGCCSARSFYGIEKSKPLPTPEEIITGIVKCGVAGNIMLFTEAYGGNQLDKLKEYVETNKLGQVVISNPSQNPYTGANVRAAIFTYDPSTLSNHVTTALGASIDRNGWWSKVDSIHMDSAFYQFGGRPKPLNSVRESGVQTLREAS